MTVYATADIIDAPLSDVPAPLLPMADEDGLYIAASFSARMVRNDYGVPGSPVWYDAEDIEVEVYDINGVDMMPKQVEERWGPEVAAALDEAAMEVADGIKDWDE